MLRCRSGLHISAWIAFAKHFKTRVVPVCSFVVLASREDVAFGHLTLTRMLAVPPLALASRPG